MELELHSDLLPTPLCCCLGPPSSHAQENRGAMGAGCWVCRVSAGWCKKLAGQSSDTRRKNLDFLFRAEGSPWRMLSRRNHVKVEFLERQVCPGHGMEQWGRDICAGTNRQRKPGTGPGCQHRHSPQRIRSAKVSLPTLGWQFQRGPGWVTLVPPGERCLSIP